MQGTYKDMEPFEVLGRSIEELEVPRPSRACQACMKWHWNCAEKILPVRTERHTGLAKRLHACLVAVKVDA